MMGLFFIAYSVIAVTIAVLSDHPSTTVVMLESDRPVNEVSITTEAGEVKLSGAGQKTTVDSQMESPQVETVDLSQMDERYWKVIHAAPTKPVSRLLYFKSGSTELTDQSLQMLDQVLEDITERKPCYVSVIGHADTQGASDVNTKLSLQRAQSVARLLMNREPEGIVNMSTQSYGEEDLLVKTPDGVSEPKNRRVEILIR